MKSLRALPRPHWNGDDNRGMLECARHEGHEQFRSFITALRAQRARDQKGTP